MKIEFGTNNFIEYQIKCHSVCSFFKVIINNSRISVFSDVSQFNGVEKIQFTLVASFPFLKLYRFPLKVWLNFEINDDIFALFIEYHYKCNN